MAGLARFAIRFRYFIIAFWIIAGALCIALFPSLGSAVNTDNSSFLPSGEPSVHALNLAAPFQPTNDTTGTLVVLGQSKLSSSDQQAVTNLQKKVAKDDHVVSVSDQGLSKDGRVDKAQVIFNVQTSSTDASPTVAAVRSTMSGFTLPSGLSSYLTGQLPSAVDNQNSQAHAQKLTEDLSVLIILVMLIIVFRAVAAPLVTLLPAIWVLLMSGAIIAEISKAGLQVSTITQTMLTVLLLGAGTDYGLFFIMRVREEMADGASPHRAIEQAGRYVGESITFSAGTVIVALVTLLLASFGLYSGLGPALALGVFLMLLAALTLMPALLAVFGRAVFWPRPVRRAKEEGVYAKLADKVIAHPVVTLVCGVVFLVALGVFTFGYTSAGFGGQTTGPDGSQSAHGTNVINAHYPPAVANPTQVLMVWKSSVWKDLSQANTAENNLAKKSVFASVTGPFDPNGTKLTPSQLSSLYSELGPPGKLPAAEPAGTPVPADQYELYRAEAQFISADGKTVQYYTSLQGGLAVEHRGAERHPGGAQRGDQRAALGRRGGQRRGRPGPVLLRREQRVAERPDQDRAGGHRAARAAARPAAAQRHRPAVPGRHRAAQLLRRAGSQRAHLPGRRGPVRAELRAAVPVVHLPDGPRRGLQHPGHEPDPGGGA